MPGVPGVPGVPGAGDLPGVPGVPEVPEIPAIPSIPPERTIPDEYTTLQENVEKLQELGFSSEFNLAAFLLSEDEVIKKLLADSNPYLTPENLDMIVDDEEKLKEKYNKEDEDEEDEEDEDEGVEEDEDEDINDQDLEDNNQLTKEEKAAIKEQRKAERELRKEQRKVERELQKEKRKAEREAQKEKRKAEREARKKEKEEEIKVMKQVYKDKKEEQRKRAKKILKDIKLAFFNLLKEIKALIKKGITSAINTASAIGAIAVIAVAPPFNIPLAVSFTMVVIELILDLMLKCKDIVMLLSPVVDILPFVLPPANLSIIANILNPLIVVVLEFWEKLSFLDKLIQTLLDKIMELLNGNSRNKIFRKATRKLRKLGHFKNNNDKYEIEGKRYRADSEEDAAEVADLLDIFKVNNSTNKVFDYVKNIDDKDLKNLGLPDKPIVAKEDLPESLLYLYDVQLPNGSILYNKTESDIEELRKVYKIVVGQIQNINDTDLS